MTEGGLRKRFPRLVILVVADFRVNMEDVRALRKLVPRLEVAGIGGDAERAEMEALGIDAAGVSAERDAVLEAALDRLAAADAVLFGSGEWTAERTEIFESEREQAVADGRSLRPLIAKPDERYEFLRSPEEWATFTAARAAGADFETAKDFAGARNQKRGHKDKDRKPGSGRRSRAPGTRGGKTR